MDKQTFFDELGKRLSDLGVRNDYIEKHIGQFDSYFEGKTDGQIEEEIEKLGNIDRLSLRIKRMTDKMILSESGIPLDSTESEETAGSEEEPAETEMSSVTVEDAEEEAQEADSTDNPPSEIEIESPIYEKHRKKKIWESELELDEIEAEDDDSDDIIDEYENAETDSKISKQLKLSKKTDEQIKSNLTKFRIIFFLSIPLIIAVVLITAALFGALFFAIALLVIAAAALLAAVTVVGSAVSIFGLIFGAVQLISSLPIGLYECGLSLMFGSAALFVGILIYNFTVRLMPYAASKLLQLMKFVFRKYRILYIYIKKECLQL